VVQDNSLDSVSLDDCASFQVSECTIAVSVIWDCLTINCRAGDLVTSDQGKIMQRQVWTEIVESLGSRVPSDLASVPDRLGR